MKIVNYLLSIIIITAGSVYTIQVLGLSNKLVFGFDPT